MGLFGHMRIHESRIRRSPDTPSTPTMPSPAHAPQTIALTAISSTTLSTSCRPTLPIPTHTQSFSAPTTTTTTTTTEADTDTVDLSCPHCSRTFASRIGLIGHLRSMVQRLANQCLKHQPTLTASASTVHIALAHFFTSWVYRLYARARKPAVDHSRLHHIITSSLTSISLHINLTHLKHPTATSYASGKHASGLLLSAAPS
ncbi:hypothetical protein SprV_0501809200 [Sparganum proliferum]